MKNKIALTPPTLKNKLCMVDGSATIKRPVAWSNLAPVACWYACNASEASKIRVAPMVSFHFVSNVAQRMEFQTCVNDACTGVKYRGTSGSIPVSMQTLTH
jgi:hypothetical protein